MCVILVPDNKVIYSSRSVLSERAADDWFECIEGAADGFAMTVPKLSERWELDADVQGNCFDGTVYYGEREALFVTAQGCEVGSAQAWKRTFSELNLKAPIKRPAAPWIVVSAVPHGAAHSAHVVAKLVCLPELLGWAWSDWVHSESEETEPAQDFGVRVRRKNNGINIEVNLNFRL